MSKHWFSEHESQIKSFLLRNTIITASHPIEYAKVLVQLGYEPFVATESTSVILRMKYLGLPNLLTYLKYIGSVDGYLGCYRGLIPRLCYANVYFLVYNKISEYYPGERTEEISVVKGVTEEGDECKSTRKFSKYVNNFISPDVRDFINTLSWDVVSIAVGTTVSYPFHLIAVRSMAQFVGRETKYDSLWGSITEIYKSEGFFGFFNGIVPRLISEVLTVVIAGTFIYVVTKHISNKNQQITNLGGSLLANAFAYQYYLVSNNMAVNNSGLALGDFPYTKTYTSWYDCWNTLRREGQLSRAANVVARQYVGPAAIEDGHLVPLNFHFGPIHPKGLGEFESHQATITYETKND